MSRALFGTDGVRGLAGQYPLDQVGAYAIGRAVGTLFAQPGEQIVIGSDPRESSADIVADITKGLESVGVDVALVGVLPTPGLAYLARERREFVAGIMVTASHNPYEYNGVKVFDRDGNKLPDETEVTLNQLITDGVPDRSRGTAAQREQLQQEYEDFLIATAEGLDLHGMRIAVDSANGAASGLAARVFTQLGAQVVALADQPDGRNINQACGATNTTHLQETVVAQGLALGIALDGDADRIIMVDSQGRACNGDQLVYALAAGFGYKGAVMTVMTNLGAEHAFADRRIALERVAVGDRYVLEGLAQTHFEIGGEQSGHIILPHLLKTGDALLAAVQVLRVIAMSNTSLDAWRDQVQLLPQALINVPLNDVTKLDTPSIQEYITEQQRILGDMGRILIRPSGTEPLVRVMVEAPNAQAIAEVIAHKIQEMLV